MGRIDELLKAVGKAAPEPKYIRARPPLPPPPKPLPDLPKMSSEVAERYEELMRRLAATSPPPEGLARLYRVGETATEYQPPKTVRFLGQDVPYEQFVAMKESQVGFNPNPKGAAGRWATDAPHELDFYIGENPITAPIYRFDVPASEVSQLNVRNTPFLKNSRNPDREFILPDNYLEQAVRVLTPLAPIMAAGAMGGRD